MVNIRCILSPCAQWRIESRLLPPGREKTESRSLTSEFLIAGTARRVLRGLPRSTWFHVLCRKHGNHPATLERDHDSSSPSPLRSGGEGRGEEALRARGERFLQSRFHAEGPGMASEAAQISPGREPKILTYFDLFGLIWTSFLKFFHRRPGENKSEGRAPASP